MMPNAENNLSIPIIGYHRSPLSQKFGIPRQPNLVAYSSYIELLEPYATPEAFEGIEQFSHLWITWQAHHNYLKSKNEFQPFKPKVRPPRLGGNAKLGVFATRSTYRPSQLGLSVVRLIRVDVIEGRVRLHIAGADMVDGTPIIDIKPYIAYSDAIMGAVSGYASQKPVIMPVSISESARLQFDSLMDIYSETNRDKCYGYDKSNGYDDNNETEFDSQSASLSLEAQLTKEDKDIICQLISQDPRPAYRQSDSSRVYYMRYKQYDVGFQWVQQSEDGSCLQIVSIHKI